jgi:DNA polymerase III epsilon subunit-like protein
MSTYGNVTILNTETTGVDFSKDEIIALALGRHSKAGNWVADVTYYDADKAITPEISSLHDITPSMLPNTKFYEGAGDLAPNIKDYVVSNNASFHVNMVNRNGVDVLTDKKVICTMRIAKKLSTMDLDVSNFKLNYLRYYFGVNVSRNDFNTNTEMNNVITGELFGKQCELLLGMGEISSIDMEEVYVWANAPILMTKMPFGKHTGKRFEDIPMEYWNWALANMDALQEDNKKYDPDLAASVVSALEKFI